jgi:hypothetical protein
MSKPKSRLELNRDLRRIFARHRVDFALLQFSCHGRNVTLSGSLMKEDKRDFTASELEQMTQEVFSLKIGINSELDNWSISTGGISKCGNNKDEKEKKKQQVNTEEKKIKAA